MKSKAGQTSQVTLTSGKVKLDKVLPDLQLGWFFCGKREREKSCRTELFTGSLGTKMGEVSEQHL